MQNEKKSEFPLQSVCRKHPAAVRSALQPVHANRGRAEQRQEDHGFGERTARRSEHRFVGAEKSLGHGRQPGRGVDREATVQQFARQLLWMLEQLVG